MIGGLLRFVILRVLGARVLIVLTILGWLRNKLRRPSSTTSDRDRERQTRSNVRRTG